MRDLAPALRERLALALVLALAASVRFAGLAHDLARAGPSFDERTNHLEPVRRMLDAPTADPTVLQGHAGFFNWLILAPVALGRQLGGEQGEAVAARAVVAACSTFNVFLAHRVARAFFPPWSGLASALALAVSPLEVQESHHATPDVLVATGLLGLLLVLRGFAGRGSAVLAGALLGVSTAVKYTGGLLAAALVAGSIADLRQRRFAPTWAAAALAAFALAAPYAALGIVSGQAPTPLQVIGDYYGAGASTNRFARGEGSALPRAAELLAQTLGAFGVLLALAAYPLTRDRSLLPPLAVLVCGTLAAAPANLIYPRHLVPVAAAAAVLLGAGAGAVCARLPRRLTPAAVAGMAALALHAPAATSLRLARAFHAPSRIDLAARFIEAEFTGPAQVATSLEQLQLDPRRFEVRLMESLEELPPRVLLRFDLLVARSADEAERLRGFLTLGRFASLGQDPRRSVTVLRPEPGRAPEPRIAPRPDGVRASSGEPLLAIDGDPKTAFRGAPGPGWIELAWSAPLVVDSVELLAGGEPASWPLPARLSGSLDGASWARLDAAPLRPTRRPRQRPGAGHGQVFVLSQALALRGLKITRSGAQPWSIAELRVYVAPAAEAR